MNPSHGNSRARVSAFVAAFLATVGLLILGGGIASATGQQAAGAVPTYAYDGDHHSALPTYTRQERGPPGTYDHAAAYDAVGRRPHGARAS